MHGTGTMVGTRQQVLFQWPAVTLSERAPTTNLFLTNSKNNPTIDTGNEHDRNTVDARTFPWVSAATPRAV